MINDCLDVDYLKKGDYLTDTTNQLTSIISPPIIQQESQLLLNNSILYIPQALTMKLKNI